MASLEKSVFITVIENLLCFSHAPHSLSRSPFNSVTLIFYYFYIKIKQSM